MDKDLEPIIILISSRDDVRKTLEDIGRVRSPEWADHDQRPPALIVADFLDEQETGRVEKIAESLLQPGDAVLGLLAPAGYRPKLFLDGEACDLDEMLKISRELFNLVAQESEVQSRVSIRHKLQQVVNDANQVRIIEEFVVEHMMLHKRLQAQLEKRTEELAHANKKLQESFSQLRDAQAQLVQVGKLAGLGELSAGIAHELNQPITSIRGFVQLLHSKGICQAPEDVDTMDRILKATERISRIVGNLRTFARQSDFRLKPTRAVAPLDDALDLVSEQLRLHEIQVVKDIVVELPEVMAEGIQLQQVFLNLLFNARYALDCLDAGQSKRLLLAVRVDGPFVEYVVEDNGPGISEGKEQQIFDPFFTTKPPGEGMGLGLSLSYGIVKNHGGEITFERAPTGGARFIVKVPIAKSNADAGNDREEA